MAPVDGYTERSASHRSECPHCPETILEGDAIVWRSQDDAWVHPGCAVFADRLAEDPEGVLAEERAEWERGRAA